MKKKTIIITLVSLTLFLILSSVAVYYLNTTYIPRILKTKITEELSRKLNAAVTLDSVRFNLFKGIILENLSLREAINQEPTIQIKKASAQVLIIPFFHQKKIVFPAIEINDVLVNVIRNKDASLNLARFAPKQTQTTEKNQFPVFVYKFNCTAIRVHVQDNALATPLTHDAVIDSLRGHVAAPGYTFSLRGQLTTKGKTSRVTLDGAFNLATKTLSASTRVDTLDVPLYLVYAPELEVKIPAATLNNTSLQAAYKLNDHMLSLDATTTIENGSISRDDLLVNAISSFVKIHCAVTFLDKTSLIVHDTNFSLKGSFALNQHTTHFTTEGNFNPKTKIVAAKIRSDEFVIPTHLSYFDNLPGDLQSCTLSNTTASLSYDIGKNSLSVETETKIQNAALENKDFTVSDASAHIKAQASLVLGQPKTLTYAAHIDQTTAQLGHANFPEEINLMQASVKVVPNHLEIKDATLSLADMLFTVNGTVDNFSDPRFSFDAQSTINLEKTQTLASNFVKDLSKATVQGTGIFKLTAKKTAESEGIDINGTLLVNNAALLAPQLPPITAINGLITFDQDVISWDKLTFSALNQPFSSKATISNFNAPFITGQVSSNDYSVDAAVRMVEKKVFSVEKLTAKFLGSSVSIKGDIALPSASVIDLDIDVNAQLVLDNLRQIPFLSNKEQLALLNPQGVIKVTGSLEGNAKNLASLNGSLQLSSDTLNCYNLTIKTLSASIVPENGQIKIPESSCSFYQGTIAVNGLVDIEKKDYPFALKVQISDVDLSELKKDTKLKDQELQGILNATFVSSGNFKSPLDLKGQGAFLVKDGYLWEFNPLNQLGNYLFIPQYQSLIFKEAKGDIVIQDRTLYTDQISLDSDKISLICRGNMDFKGNLNFEITPQASAQVIGTDIRNAAIAGAASGAVVLQVKGTVQKPQIERKIMPEKVFGTVLKGIGEKIFGKQE